MLGLNRRRTPKPPLPARNIHELAAGDQVTLVTGRCFTETSTTYAGREGNSRKYTDGSDMYVVSHSFTMAPADRKTPLRVGAVRFTTRSLTQGNQKQLGGVINN